MVLLLGAGWIGLSRPPAGVVLSGQPPVARSGFVAPDFVADTLGGESLHLIDVRGKPVILNLWASWCPPCKAEMPALQRVYTDYASQGLLVIAVNMTYQDSRDAAAQFVAAHQLTFPILLDDTGEISRSYQLSALPTTYFIGADGKIRDVVIGGPISEAFFRTQAESLLKELH
jgi:cytochrome c biogenesis protein CcmG/thiol:disulfide interchange protein DsbE